MKISTEIYLNRLAQIRGHRRCDKTGEQAELKQRVHRSSLGRRGVSFAPYRFGGASTTVSLLQETLHELHCQSPPPGKDFHRFPIPCAEVIWSTWRISFQPSQEKVFPKEVKKLHTEFLLDQQLQKRVRNIFGNNTLEYTVNLCQRHYNFLIRMPKNLIVHMLSFLDADDLQQLSKTCKKFQQLFSSEEFWERVKLLREKPALGKKKMTFSVFKKSFNEKPKRMQRRQSAFF
ncbi:F-box only protein 36-like [Gymnogyps californianus]|uniref:F-box only protein 36-like n=1 Tax=Gymnogyps californianus TaxID=33616 RepID=UPI0021C9F894|nr:F-box only protein 36-like [Gymnogyps californianus]